MGRQRWGRIFAAGSAVLAALAVLATVVLTRQDRPRQGGYFSSLQGVEMNSVEVHAQGSGLPSRPFPTSVPTLPKPSHTRDTGCRIGQGPSELPAVPAPVKSRVDKAWARIERWLSAHAPASEKSLAPPAAPEKIAAMQKQIGVTLPPELVASLERHDGVARPGDVFTFSPFYEPLSADRISNEAKMMCDVLADLGDDSVESWWSGRFVPFAVDNGGGSLFLDQRGGTGRLGEHDNEGPISFDRWPGTLAELLEQNATALETGGTLQSFRTVVTEKGTLDWEVVR